MEYNTNDDHAEPITYEDYDLDGTGDIGEVGDIGDIGEAEPVDQPVVLNGTVNSHLYKIVMFKDVAQMIMDGKVPRQPDDDMYGGVCLYERRQLTQAAAAYFGVMPDSDIKTVKAAVRIYQVSRRALSKRRIREVVKYDDVTVLKYDRLLRVRYLIQMVM